MTCCTESASRRTLGGEGTVSTAPGSMTRFLLAPTYMGTFLVRVTMPTRKNGTDNGKDNGSGALDSQR